MSYQMHIIPPVKRTGTFSTESAIVDL